MTADAGTFLTCSIINSTSACKGSACDFDNSPRKRDQSCQVYCDMMIIRCCLNIGCVWEMRSRDGNFKSCKQTKGKKEFQLRKFTYKDARKEDESGIFFMCNNDVSTKDCIHNNGYYWRIGGHIYIRNQSHTNDHEEMTKSKVLSTGLITVYNLNCLECPLLYLYILSGKNFPNCLVPNGI